LVYPFLKLFENTDIDQVKTFKDLQKALEKDKPILSQYYDDFGKQSGDSKKSIKRYDNVFVDEFENTKMETKYDDVEIFDNTKILDYNKLNKNRQLFAYDKLQQDLLKKVLVLH
jgi:hypothetical protein